MTAAVPVMPLEPTTGCGRRSRKAMRRARRDGQGWHLRPDHPLRGWRLPLMILGFIAWWPIGLALLTLFLTWRPAMSFMPSALSGTWTAPWADRLRDGLPRGGSGNVAFDEYRAAVLRRLEEERRALDAQQEEFAAFVLQLRRAKDQEEFDRFIAGRGAGRA